MEFVPLLSARYQNKAHRQSKNRLPFCGGEEEEEEEEEEFT